MRFFLVFSVNVLWVTHLLGCDLERSLHGDFSNDERFEELEASVITPQMRWGLTTAVTPEQVLIRRHSSKHLGWVYLISRTMEYNFKVPAILIADEDLAQHLLLAGLCFGNIGNVFQAYQGAFDWKTYRLQTERVISIFAVVAVMRGVGNLLADGAAISILYAESDVVGSVSELSGMSTDVLGLIKNVKDVFKTQDLKKLAFTLCTISRFPFLLAAALTIIDRSSPLSGELLTLRNTASLTAMGLFNTGAFIRLALDRHCRVST